ncbi:MAG: hypothetical protein B7C55_10710 [Actinomycetales bacterium mxb001]|nr:MAG: hypothetical protein B7C55_10710 [Actinomycetales bacterium mxb001]
MAKERARKRAEREAQAARDRQERARTRARKERLDRGKKALTSLVPDAPKRTPGLLARRRRRRLMAFAATIMLIQVIVWPLLPTWTARLVVLALSLVIAPVAWVLAFGRV